MHDPTLDAPTRELLTWVSRTPRTYTATMEAWRSSCPRLTIWEDALTNGLVRVVSNGGTSTVVVTATGQAALHSA